MRCVQACKWSAVSAAHVLRASPTPSPTSNACSYERHACPASTQMYPTRGCRRAPATGDEQPSEQPATTPADQQQRRDAADADRAAPRTAAGTRRGGSRATASSWCTRRARREQVLEHQDQRCAPSRAQRERPAERANRRRRSPPGDERDEQQRRAALDARPARSDRSSRAAPARDRAPRPCANRKPGVRRRAERRRRARPAPAR